MNWLKMLFGGASSAPVADKDDVLRVVWRPGSYPFQVVGESHYQAALSRLCGGHSRGGHELACRARLIPELTNAYDHNALKVMIGKAVVGYVPREQAERLKAEANRVWTSRRGHRSARDDPRGMADKPIR